MGWRTLAVCSHDESRRKWRLRRSNSNEDLLPLPALIVITGIGAEAAHSDGGMQCSSTSYARASCKSRPAASKDERPKRYSRMKRLLTRVAGRHSSTRMSAKAKFAMK